MLSRVERHYTTLEKFSMVKEKERGVSIIKLKKVGDIQGVIVSRKHKKVDMLDGTVVEIHGFMYSEPWVLKEGDVVKDEFGCYRVISIDNLMGKGPFVKYYIESIDTGGVEFAE